MRCEAVGVRKDTEGRHGAHRRDLRCGVDRGRCGVGCAPRPGRRTRSGSGPSSR
ncbi:MAG: hypothetical protein MZV64_27885 [Ignavibacteriales bacterium]|nr:hypothetical protein [Ignavibacteriales bacterium]